VLVGRVLYAFDAAQQISVKFDELFAAIKPVYMVRREQYFENEAELLVDLLRDGVHNDEIDVTDIPLTAISLVLATNALMPFSLSARQLKDRPGVELRASKIADLLLRGMSRGMDNDG
jgi:hypothetical protein